MLHCFAVKVMNELGPFSDIVPCGLDGCRMTSLAEITEAPCSVPHVAEWVAEEFSAVFQLEWTVTIPTDSSTADDDGQSVAAIVDR